MNRFGRGSPAAFAIIPLLLLAACGGTSDSTPDLAGRTFLSVDTPGHTLVDGTTVEIAFEDERLSARAGCNTIFGAARWSGGSLSAQDLASTRMACSPELSEQDDWLSDLLTGNPSISLDGTTLTVGDASSGIVLEEVAS